MTQAAELAGYASNLQMFRNKIINGNFDVWQRGTNITISNSTNMYTADRWRFAGDAFTGFINRQHFTPGQTDVPGEPNYFFRWAVNTNPSGNMAFGQYIEDVRTLAGRTATLSLYLYASATIPANTLQIRYRQVTGGTGGTNNTINIGEITTSWKKFTFQLNIPSLTGASLGASNYLALEILSPSTHTTAFDLFIAQVQLEEGTVATPFEHRPIGMELSLCQRYAHFIRPQAAYGAIGVGRAWSNTQGAANVYLPVPMRGAIAIHYSNLTHFDLAGAGEGVSSLHNDGSTLQTVKVGWTRSSNVTSNVYYQLEFEDSNWQNAYLGFTSEL